MNADDMLVRDTPRQHQLPLELPLCALVLAIGPDDFEGHGEAQLVIPSLVDRAHAPDAKQADDAIARAELVPDFELRAGSRPGLAAGTFDGNNGDGLRRVVDRRRLGLGYRVVGR